MKEEGLKQKFEKMLGTTDGDRISRKHVIGILNETIAEIKKIMNPNANCKCGWKGTEKDLEMDEAIEFHCPKCKQEIEIKGCHPEVVLVLQKVLKVLDSEEWNIKEMDANKYPPTMVPSRGTISARAR